MEKTYYLIDTNVFIDCPEILDRIPDGNFVIIVNHVIYELDGLHKKDDTRIKAKEAQNNIHSNSGRDEVILLHTKTPYPPFEKPFTMDQKILSAAFRPEFKDGKVVLLSTDMNMRLMADGLRVESYSLKEFLAKNHEVIKREKRVSWKKILGCIGLVSIGALFGYLAHEWQDNNY